MPFVIRNDDVTSGRRSKNRNSRQRHHPHFLMRRILLQSELPHTKRKCSKCPGTGYLESRCRKPKLNDSHSEQTGIVHESSHLIRKTFNVNGVPVEFCLDTGAEADIQNEITYRATDKPPHQKFKEFGRGYDGRKIPFLGKDSPTFRYGNITTEEYFFVFRHGTTIPLRIDAMFRYGFLGPKICINSAKGVASQSSFTQYVSQWPLLDGNVEGPVSDCPRAHLPQRIRPKQNSWPKTTKPMQRIHVDYVGRFMAHNFLVTADAYSKYPQNFRWHRRGRGKYYYCPRTVLSLSSRNYFQSQRYSVLILLVCYRNDWLCDGVADWLPCNWSLTSSQLTD